MDSSKWIGLHPSARPATMHRETVVKGEKGENIFKIIIIPGSKINCMQYRNHLSPAKLSMPLEIAQTPTV